MDLGLADKVCLVTGSTGGIGLETVELLRAEGADVVATGRSGGDIRADLSRPGEPERVVREVEEQGDRYSAVNLRATALMLLGLASDDPDLIDPSRWN